MILKLFLFWRFGLFIVSYLGSVAMPRISNTGIGAIGQNREFNFWNSWAQWDGGHYFDIATSGYQNVSDSAFFPLYPLIVKLFSVFFGGSVVIAGLVASSVFFLTFLYCLKYYLGLKYSQKIAYLTAVNYLVFPTSFFAASFYSESLFLLLSILVFIFIKKEKYFESAIFVSLAALCRPIGIFLLISLIYAFVKGANFNLRSYGKYLFYVFVSFSGFGVWMLYLQLKFDDPLAFLNVQATWSRWITDPLTTIFGYIWAIVTFQSRPFNDYADLFVTLFFLIILWVNLKKIPSSLWIFSMIAILIPASTSTLTSMPRYVLSAIGFFVILSKILENRLNVRVFLWTISLILQSILVVLFINGYWVA